MASSSSLIVSFLITMGSCLTGMKLVESMGSGRGKGKLCRNEYLPGDNMEKGEGVFRVEKLYLQVIIKFESWRIYILFVTCVRTIFK